MSTPAGTATVTRSVDVQAPPAAVFDLVTDLDVLAELADEAYAMAWQRGDRAAAGNVFKGRNRNGRRRWSTTCVVTDAEPGATFAFDVVHPMPRIPISHWRYDIVATETGCQVTESTWDLRPGWFRKPAELVTGVGDRTGGNGRNIETTLARLRERAETGSRG